MRKMCMGVAAVAALAWGSLDASSLHAQERDLPLRPVPPEGRPVTPFLEGWYDNADGSVTLSFGYFNRNDTTVVEIPRGEKNQIEPDRFDGMQPTTFMPGRHHGVFAVTLPAEMRDEDVWWSITNDNGEVHRVPGRARASAYELDRNPRPQGSRQPVVWFEEGGEKGAGPEGVMADEVETAEVGSPLTLTIHAVDPSERDREDPRFRDPIPVRVSWFKHQGPGRVEFERHPSTQELEDESPPRGISLPGMRRLPPGPYEVYLPEGEGTARVRATFSEPGDYLLRARIDNWGAPDSDGLDQCCWSNGYVRVRVAP